MKFFGDKIFYPKQAEVRCAVAPLRRCAVAPLRRTYAKVPQRSAKTQEDTQVERIDDDEDSEVEA